MNIIAISTLAHMWLIDIDGTILQHNGHKIGQDVLLPGVRHFWDSIPAEDVIVLLSARTREEMPATLAFLDEQGLRYDHSLFGMPEGERILINDVKPMGLKTAVAVNVSRNAGLLDYKLECDPLL